jgi:hemoglobin-like flavoprotein
MNPMSLTPAAVPATAADREGSKAPLTAHQIDLVQATFAKVVPIAETAAQLFYGRLFEIAPQVKPLFRHDMSEQGRKLMTTIGIVVKSLKNLEAILPAVRTLAVKHVRYGVKPSHYDQVGEALIWTLEQGLGADFTAEVKEAWLATYTTLARVMIEEAYEAVEAA